MVQRQLKLMVPATVHDRLREEARREYTSIASVVRRALAWYYESLEIDEP